MLPEQVAPPEGGDVDRGPQTLIIFWVTAALSVVVVALRFLGRHLRQRTGLDDWLMLATLGFYIMFVAVLTKVISIGGMRHIYYLDQRERVRAVKWHWMCHPFVVMGFSAGKLSVGVLLWRVVGSTTFWRKWSLCFAVMAAFVWSIVVIALTFAQCSPPRALWEQSLVAQGKATCWSPTIIANFAIFLSTWNILTDLFLAFLPATFLYNLDLTVKKKLGLCLLLGLGATAAVFAAVKTSYLSSLTARSDITWETYNLYLWSGMELFVIIVCGSVPPIKPVCDHVFRLSGLSTAKATGYGRFDSDPCYQSSATRSRRAAESAGKKPEEVAVELAMSPAVRGDAVSTHSTTHSLHPRRDETYSPRR
ncbi:hypothetical protein EsDP_00002879 [Epichloe bromicola]|uniref:Rhodopsin domain-containing protein n=1 Tax=Epichloe bromicola TaxID=79588 RepID=A0ABQ0CMM3_9HYPO